MRIRWTEPASRDLIQICDYLGKEDSRAARSDPNLRKSPHVDGLP